MNAVPAAREWAIPTGNLEALKWLALLAMLVDHVNTVFFGRSVDAMFYIGRFAMPVFALVLAYNLARPGVDLARVGARLLLWGVAVQPWHVLTIGLGHFLPLNILLTFAAGVAVVIFTDRGQWLHALAVLLCASFVVDYSFVGVMLVPCAVLAFRTREPLHLGALTGVIAMLCLQNGNLFALLGVAAFVWAGILRELPIPRVRNLFWIAYPAHLVALGVVVLLGRFL